MSDLQLYCTRCGRRIFSSRTIRKCYPIAVALVASAALMCAGVASAATPMARAATLSDTEHAWLVTLVRDGKIDQTPRRSPVLDNGGCTDTLMWSVANAGTGANPNDYRQNLPVVACKYVATPPGLRPKQAAENGEGVGITVVLAHGQHGLVPVAVTTSSMVAYSTQYVALPKPSHPVVSDVCPSGGGLPGKYVVVGGKLTPCVAPAGTDTPMARVAASLATPPPPWLSDGADEEGTDDA